MYANGVALSILGVVLLAVRLRERPFHRAMFGIVWARLCCTVGGALPSTLPMMATGYIEQLREARTAALALA